MAKDGLTIEGGEGGEATPPENSGGVGENPPKNPPKVSDSVNPRPENGHDKFYDPKTGDYNWEGHSKEVQYNFDKLKEDSAKPFVKEDLMKEVESGVLSEQTSEAFKKLGLDDIASGYFKSTQDYQNLLTEHQDVLVGGSDRRKSILDWASKNLNADEIKTFNSDTLDKDKFKDALLTLASKYDKAIGADSGSGAVKPDFVGANSGKALYQSADEMFQEMQDPKYSRDPAFREQVKRKLAMSKQAGTI